MFWHMDDGRDHSARKLLNYLNRSRERFIEYSEEYGHEKQVILSPERGDELSDREMSLAVRTIPDSAI